jgi:eukaryotic-like serine/threonine-protein kinase
LVQTIADAVDYAHQRRILHRDLKPSNILIDSLQQPHITDFGLAKKLGGGLDLTQTGQVLGSPSYLPPEQAGGRQEPVGPPSDVYSLGAILYRLITGQPPFAAHSLPELLRRVSESIPVPPSKLNPKIPRDLETICLKCLEKSSLRRYASCKELSQDLARPLL